MFALVFSWATTSTEAGKNSLLPVWSPCVWVLMIVVTGLSVTERILSMICWPQLASLVSTITTPFEVTNAAVLPPPPLITNRLSFSFSIVATCGCAACARGGACCARIPIAPTASNIPSSAARLICPLL